MNPHLTEIAYILDRSGSMQPMQEPAVAARPPENPYFQKDRDTIEKRSGRWLKELARQSQTAGFDLNAWIPAWGAGSSGRQISAWN